MPSIETTTQRLRINDGATLTIHKPILNVTSLWTPKTPLVAKVSTFVVNSSSKSYSISTPWTTRDVWSVYDNDGQDCPFRDKVSNQRWVTIPPGESVVEASADLNELYRILNPEDITLPEIFYIKAKFIAEVRNEEGSQVGEVELETDDAMVRVEGA
ncbi:hypothetical protein SpCBS45565_g04912 [Spizellomyces sp. 'palustris']|nr:hypothetical protein SpCBS45565_g04912 [Spizellomyces sp. 'palustris']